MLVYDNGNFCLFANTRCGHTSMTEYFGLPLHNSKLRMKDWVESSNRRILVLRNPYDRLVSAIRHAERYPRDITKYKDYQLWIDIHSRPYLREISHLDFEIIDFTRLLEYIPISRFTRVTNTNNVLYTDITPELQIEYDHYIEYMANRKQITPEEWKELTKQ